MSGHTIQIRQHPGTSSGDTLGRYKRGSKQAAIARKLAKARYKLIGSKKANQIHAVRKWQDEVRRLEFALAKMSPTRIMPLIAPPPSTLRRFSDTDLVKPGVKK